MRMLLITRGCPGAGKSTWIKEHHLEPYTLCPDDIRVMCSSRELNARGGFAIARNNATEKATWRIIMDLLEYRMSRGEFTVLDATASKTKDIQQYRDLAEKYRYRMYCVDFTGVPLEECLRRNRLRCEDKVVPDDGIRMIYARFAAQPVPGRVEVIKPDELDKILEKPVELSQYKKIVFVGDIHGCYDTLMQYPDFKDGLKDDVEYIFLGDYIDRGANSAKVLGFLSSIMNKPNVCLLEGNHEKYLRDYGEGDRSRSDEFEGKTKPQLIEAGFDEKAARVFYRKLRQMSHFTWNGIEVLACHGGIPCMRENLSYLPTAAFVNGVGDYKEYQDVADTWMASTNGNQFLVHGHRNTQDDPTRIADRVFNLEGAVEFGGKLRIVELEKTGQYPEYGEVIDENGQFPKGLRIPVGFNTLFKWNIVELKSVEPVSEADLAAGRLPVDTVHDAIEYLRANRFVSEKRLANGVSSFNFTREAFYDANWNMQTILARGLFIDTEHEKIMARSYEKFFRINEVADTQLPALKQRLKFPVNAYVKENGFLAIVSYDYNKDDLFVASKSTTAGDYAGYIHRQLAPYREKLLAYFRESYAQGADSLKSFVFECIDVENDPHIIKYREDKLVLLDVVYNELAFKTVSYETLVEYAKGLGCPVKELAYTLKDWDAFMALYNESQSYDYRYGGEFIEGFVFVDSAGFMTKCKTGYYNFWKRMRSVADATLRCGNYRYTGALTSVADNAFYGFCRALYNNDRDPETKQYPFKTDIISLRELMESTISSNIDNLKEKTNEGE